MTSTDASELLRPDLLAGVGMLIAGAPGEGSWARAIAEACTQLGARVRAHDLEGLAGEELHEESATDAAVQRALGELGELDALVVDAATPLATGPSRRPLVDCLQATWAIARAVANVAFIAPERRGKIVLVAPAPAAGTHAEPARAGLENLSRTLSIEWARYGITPVTIAPGDRTEVGEVAALTAYLASPAGDYFSGCLFDLRGPGPR